MVAGWMFGGTGCHAKSKGVESSYKLGYLITAALFYPVRPVRPVRPDRQGLSAPPTLQST